MGVRLSVRIGIISFLIFRIRFWSAFVWHIQHVWICYKFYIIYGIRLTVEIRERVLSCLKLITWTEMVISKQSARDAHIMIKTQSSVENDIMKTHINNVLYITPVAWVSDFLDSIDLLDIVLKIWNERYYVWILM